MTTTVTAMRPTRARCSPGSPATRSTRRARTPPWTCSGCSTTASCGSRPTRSTTPTATGSCSPRATGRPPTTPCWRPRASSRRSGSTTWRRGPARSATIRTGCSSPAWRSPPARSATACRSASGSRSGLRAQGLHRRRASTCCSATPSWTRAPTTRRSPTPAPPGWPASPRSWSTTAPHARMAGRHRRPLHRQRLDRGHRGRPRPRPHRGRRCGPTTPAARTSSSPVDPRRRVTSCATPSTPTTHALLDDDPRTALVLADISAAAFARAARRPSRPGHQRRHPRAAHGRAWPAAWR